MSDHPPSADKGSRPILGAVLMACGALVTALCGLCSAVFLFPPEEPGMGPQFGWHQPGTVVMVAIIGGIPFLAGVAAFLIGLKIALRRN
jgi:branched-subunit amino acid ABC-type transport system permease component